MATEKSEELEVVRHYCASPDEEWYEWCVYRGDELMGRFLDKDEADAFVSNSNAA